MRGRAEFAVALLLDLIGAAVVLLVATREWQTITTVRTRPFATDVLAVSGRTVDSASTALALVALAGVVAVLATRGVVRRGVGVLIALAGAGIIFGSALAMSAVSVQRARDLVRAKHEVVGNTTAVSRHVSTHVGWAALSITGGVLVLCGGVLVAWRGARWAAMSTRYEPPDSGARPKADARLWTALERGEDPTADAPDDPR